MNDNELIEKLNNPDSKNYASNLLVRKYQQKVYWHIRKMVISHDDADDLTQETFIKAWKGLDSFKGQSQLYTWLYRIATNECLNFLDKKKDASSCLSTMWQKNCPTKSTLLPFAQATIFKSYSKKLYSLCPINNASFST